MLIENNVFKNSGNAIEKFEGNPAPAFKSIGNIGTAKNINLNQGSVFTPSYTLSIKMNASEVESKVKPAAGNTLTLNNVAVHEIIIKNGAIQPCIISCKSGWALKNPSLSAVSFEVFTFDGKTMVSTTSLEAGKSYPLPSNSSRLLVQVNGGSPVNLYVPFAR